MIAEEKPDITMVVPFFNEEKYLSLMINSITSQDLGVFHAEIIFVDGNSTDNSVAVIKKNTNCPSIILRIINNPKKTTPCGLNIGIHAAKSDIISFGSAHAIYPPVYLKSSIELLSREDIVGGMCTKFITLDDTYISKAMSMLYLSRMGAGIRNNYHDSESKYTNTVFGGCFKRSVFDTIGLYNEQLDRGQDIDFNSRAIQAGFHILHHPDLNSTYILKTNPKDFWGRAYKTGRYLAAAFQRNHHSVGLLHALPMFLVFYFVFLSVVATLHTFEFWMIIPFITYLILLILNMLSLLSSHNFLPSLLTIPIFSSYHLVYGMGTIIGIVETIINIKAKNE